MVKKSPIALKPQEHREDAPPSWPEVQDTLAGSSGLALLLVDGHQPPAVVVSNNNSVCQAFQTSPEHARLCDPYCGTAHSRAIKTARLDEYKCHAGLTCFAKPVKIGGKRNLAVIGGRAFVKSADYEQLRERFRKGDLQSIASHEVFSNIIFSEPQRLAELVERVDKAADHLRTVSSNGGLKLVQPAIAAVVPAAPVAPALNETLEREVKQLRSELDKRSRVDVSIQNFLERINSPDPSQTYNSIINSSKALLKSERASLMLLDEEANELILKAASGLAIDSDQVGPVRVGQGVSGEVIDTGRPLWVADLRRAGRKPGPPERLYKTNSFISYPIIVSDRKVGVLNVTDKSDGGNYEEHDLVLLEMIGPHVARALERAGCEERAAALLEMSITDPLTALRNRRYLEERLSEEVNRSRRYNYSMSFMMIDIDYFKMYNDKNGHPAGDLALQMTAHCLKEALRTSDIASRYGGEEFCVLLPQTGIAEAKIIADRVMHQVSTYPFRHAESQPLGRVTISIGISIFSNEIDTPEKIIGAADNALYRAKELGRDRVELSEVNREGNE